MARKSVDFSHLHNHTEFSPLDGLQKVRAMFERAAANGQRGVGITDHKGLGAMPEAAAASAATGVKLIPGLEAYFVPDFEEVRRIHDMSTNERASAGVSLRNIGGGGKSRYHMTLLATSDEGYRELMRASDFAWHHQTPERKYPLFDMKMMSEFFKSGDVIAASGCIGSYANQLYLHGQKAKAVEHIHEMRDLFGAGNYFIEVMSHDFVEQKQVQRWHSLLHRETGIPLLATNDTHYQTREDAKLHGKFLCIQTGSQISNPTFAFSSDENDFCETEAMLRAFPEEGFPNAVSNSGLIVDRTTFQMDLSGSKYHIPAFDVPKEYSSESDMLADLCRKSLPRLYPGREREKAEVQLNYELGVIDKMGFSGYFLILWDAMDWGRRNGIRFGPGRGSAAGSIVSYCLSITSVDPLRHGLSFERFLNPSRVSMPDIDIDIENSHQSDMTGYLVSRYGEERVARIITYQTLKPKVALKDSARIHGLTANDGQALSDLFPKDEQITIREAISADPPTRSNKSQEAQAVGAWKQAKDLRDEYANGGKDGRVKETIETAANLQGYIRGTGLHAAGVILTPGPFTDLFPRAEGDGVAMACEYDKHWIDALGALKYDFLGLKTLDAITEAVGSIARDLGEKVDVESLPLDDPEVFRMIAEGDTETVFQLESEGMTRLARELDVNCFEDVSALIALYRPGPLGSNIDKQFVEAKRNGGMAEHVIHEDLRELLKETYGLCVYQEQVSAIARHFAGYSAAEADTFRKAVGKKERAILDKQEGSFKSRMTERGFGSVANEMWDMLVKFAEYAFNKAHTVSYAKISYQTAWLKRYYPAQYGVGCLSILDKEKVLGYIHYLNSLGIKVLAPDVNRSGVESTTLPDANGDRRKDSVALGLSSIARCGREFTEGIVAARGDAPFVDVLDFVDRLLEAGVKLNATNFVSLIDAGALDSLSLGAPRESLRLLAPDIMKEAREKRDKARKSGGGPSLFSVEDVPEADPWLEMAKKLRTSRASLSPIMEDCKQREAIGFFVGKHPMAKFRAVAPLLESRYPRLTHAWPATDLYQKGKVKSRYTSFGVVVSKSSSYSPNNNKPVEVVIEDEGETQISIMAFGYNRERLLSSCHVGDVVIVGESSLGRDGWRGGLRLSFGDSTVLEVVDTSDYLSSAQVEVFDAKHLRPAQLNDRLERLMEFILPIRGERAKVDREPSMSETRFFIFHSGRGGFLRFPSEQSPFSLPLTELELAKVREIFDGK